MPATACPSRRFPGMPRAIPGPLRAKGTSPLETPGCRRRAVNGGGSLGFNSRSPRRVTPRRLSLRLRSMAPLGRHHCVSAHLSRCTPAAWASAARAMQDMYSVQRNILPGQTGMCEPLRSRSRRARATALPRVARAPRYGVSARPFRRPCSREPAPTRPAWQARPPLP